MLTSVWDFVAGCTHLRMGFRRGLHPIRPLKPPLRSRSGSGMGQTWVTHWSAIGQGLRCAHTSASPAISPLIALLCFVRYAPPVLIRFVRFASPVLLHSVRSTSPVPLCFVRSAPSVLLDFVCSAGSWTSSQFKNNGQLLQRCLKTSRS